MVLVVTTQNKNNDLGIFEGKKVLKTKNPNGLGERGKTSLVFWDYYLKAPGNQPIFIITRGIQYFY